MRGNVKVVGHIGIDVAQFSLPAAIETQIQAFAADHIDIGTVLFMQSTVAGEGLGATQTGGGAIAIFLHRHTSAAVAIEMEAVITARCRMRKRERQKCTTIGGTIGTALIQTQGAVNVDVTYFKGAIDGQ